MHVHVSSLPFNSVRSAVKDMVDSLIVLFCYYNSVHETR